MQRVAFLIASNGSLVVCDIIPFTKVYTINKITKSKLTGPAALGLWLYI